MPGQAGEGKSRPGRELVGELRKAAAAFDADHRVGAVSASTDDGQGATTTPGHDALLRGEANHLRKVAALCSMAARRLLEGAAAGRTEGEAAAEEQLQAVLAFLNDQFRNTGPPGAGGSYTTDR